MKCLWLYNKISYLDELQIFQFQYPYRQTEEGIAQGHAKGKVPSIPDYSTINRRINRLDIHMKDTNSKEFTDEYIVIAIGITGIKVTNRDRWMQEKWNLKNKKNI
jgi:hypothetical protein